MGEAKRRAKQDPNWGESPIYTLDVYQHKSRELIVKIPFYVARQHTARQTNARATANVIKILAYLQEPSELNALLLTESLGENSLNEMQNLLPFNEYFWAKMEGQNGAVFHFQDWHGDSIPPDEKYQGQFQRHWASDTAVRKLAS